MRALFASLILTLLIIFSGCSDSNNGTTTKTETFIGGTTGIAIDFAEGSPPPEVFDGGTYPFSITVIVENKGEYTVPKEDARIKISGIQPTEFGTTESALTKKPDDDLTASQKDSEGDIIKGPPVYVEFTGLNYKGTLKGNNEFPIRTDICYKYQTDAVTNICILENNLDSTRETVCEVTGNKKVQNSGAPIQITNFKEYPRAQNKVRFTFSISHMGTGNVYRKDTTCSKDSKTDEDRVWVEVKSGIGSGLTCTGLTGGTSTTGYARLVGGDIQVTCTQEVSTQSDYETTININAVYDYEDDKASTILVKHAIS